MGVSSKDSGSTSMRDEGEGHIRGCAGKGASHAGPCKPQDGALKALTWWLEAVVLQDKALKKILQWKGETGVL
jgi:hypothetical protein